MRNLCKKCGQRQVALNYYKNNKAYFRTVCDHCAKKRVKSFFPWEKSGYKKKNICDRCGYSSKHIEQFNVFHADGDLLNCRHSNLKTLCANCQRIIGKEDIKWRRGDLVPDF